MATQRESIELRSSPQEAIDACRRAVGELDWNLSGEGERTLRACELPEAGACCAGTTWPSRVEIRAESRGRGESTLVIDGKIAGIDRRAKLHLDASLTDLAKAIASAHRPG